MEREISEKIGAGFMASGGEEMWDSELEISAFSFSGAVFTKLGSIVLLGAIHPNGLIIGPLDGLGDFGSEQIVSDTAWGVQQIVSIDIDQ